jgi:putative membrane protein (TIGR04086 family)
VRALVESSLRLSPLAVLIGLTIDNAATALCIRLLSGAASLHRYGLHAPPQLDDDVPPSLLVAVICLGALCSVFGGYAAGRFARRRETAHGVAVGLGDVLIGAVAVTYVAAPLPVWYNAVSFASVVPAATLGGWFAERVRETED